MKILENAGVKGGTLDCICIGPVYNPIALALSQNTSCFLKIPNNTYHYGISTCKNVHENPQSSSSLAWTTKMTCYIRAKIMLYNKNKFC